MFISKEIRVSLRAMYASIGFKLLSCTQVNLLKGNTSKVAELAVLYDFEPTRCIGITRSNHTTLTYLKVIRAIK